MSRRILITGLSTYWGGRLAQALEANPEIETVIGVDSRDPSRELERTEFVRVGTQHSLLRRVVLAAEIDTVVDTRLVVDSTTATPSDAHENNVIGTMNILAACSGPGSTVRKFVFKSSAHHYGTAQDDPAYFTESMPRPHPPQTAIERDIVEGEAGVADFAEKNPEVSVTLLRFANVLGPDVRTSHTKLFALPAVPMVLGFDPRYQFVHEDDVVAALAHVTERDLPGLYNVGGDGVLALTEVAGLLGKPYAPILPPWGTGIAAAVARRLGLHIPPEMLGQMRFGRGIDNRKLKATGFRYQYTTRESVLKLGEHMRLHPLLRDVQEPYRYEREVEEFLRWSPHVRDPSYRSDARLNSEQLLEVQKAVAGRIEAPPPGRSPPPEPRAATLPVGRPRRPNPKRRRREDAGGGDAGTTTAVEHYDDLTAAEVVPLLGSLERTALVELREHEQRSRRRTTVLSAIDRALARSTAAG